MARHHLRRWILGGVAALVVVGVGGPYVFIHFVEGPAKPKLALPSSGSSGAAGAHLASSSGSSVTGTWSVSSGSVAGYRVQEILLGQHATAAGRTHDVSGSLVIRGTTVTRARYTVALATVVSDQAQRNAQFDGRIMDVAKYPTATFTLTKPIVLAALPAPGTVVSTTATGTLTMHGTTHAVTLAVKAERLGTGIDVLADATILFADWHIANPSVGGFVTTADKGILEVLLHLRRGAATESGSSASTTTTTPGAGPGGGPGQVTIPATTLPPLSISSHPAAAR